MMISFLDSRLLFAGPFLPLYWVKPAEWSKLIGSMGIFLLSSVEVVISSTP